MVCRQSDSAATNRFHFSCPTCTRSVRSCSGAASPCIGCVHDECAAACQVDACVEMPPRRLPLSLVAHIRSGSRSRVCGALRVREESSRGERRCRLQQRRRRRGETRCHRLRHGRRASSWMRAVRQRAGMRSKMQRAAHRDACFVASAFEPVPLLGSATFARPQRLPSNSSVGLISCRPRRVWSMSSGGLRACGLS